MVNSSNNTTSFFIRFFNEIALYSGQYALFYLFMQFSANEVFWLNAGHVILLASLIVQTSALVYYGENIRYRIALSFLSLLVYTAFEWREDGMDALLSFVQMPAGIPVATMAINGAKNAALFAVQILSVKYPELVTKLAENRLQMQEEVKAKGEKLAKMRAEGK